MSDVVRDAIAALTAQLAQVSSIPVPPLGYGVDLLCVTDATAHLDETDPASVLSLAQDLFHAVTTPRGGIPDAPNRGVDLRQLLSLGVTGDKLRSIATQAHGEIAKDDRVGDSSVVIDPVNTVSITTPGAAIFDASFDDSFGAGLVVSGVRFAYRVSIAVTPKDPALSVFSLILAVTNGAALLQDIIQ